MAPGELGEFVHGSLDNARNRIVILVHGLAADEINIRILGGAADGRTIRGQGTLAMGNDQIIIDHGADIIHGQFFNLHDFVGGAETVEEMEEGDTGS